MRCAASDLDSRSVFAAIGRWCRWCGLPASSACRRRCVPGLTLAGIARTLDRVFAIRNAAAVALVINSPGGSPVQSHLIFRRIRELAEEKKLPVIAFVEDAAASGGYMLACAADEIIADPHSIVGSIGVVGGSFGFDKLIAQDRRRAPALYVGRAQGDARSVPAGGSGRRRTAEDSCSAKSTTDFIALVKSRRGAKLRGPGRASCSPANIGPGRRALGLGLVDAHRRSARDAARTVRRQGRTPRLDQRGARLCSAAVVGRRSGTDGADAWRALPRT